MSGSIGGLTTGGVDASIPLQAGRGVQQFNPLDTIGKFAATQNALNQNRLFPGQLQIQGQTIASNASSLIQQQRQAAYGTMVPLLNKPGLLTPSDATTALGGYEAAGGNSHAALTELSAGAPGDPVQYDAWLRAKIAANSQTNSEAALRTAVPGPGPQIQYGGAGTNIPPMIQPTIQAPAGSPHPGVTSSAGSPFPIGMSPDRAADRIPGGYDAQGNPIQVPIGTQPTGSPAFGGSTGHYLATPTAPGVAALRNPNSPNATAPGASPPTPTAFPAPPGSPPGAVVQPGAATTANLATQGTQSAQKFQTIADEGSAAKEQGAVLDNMQNDLQQFTSGPGAHTEAQLEKLVQGWIPGANGAFKTKIAAQESFDKLANQLVVMTGPDSDARQAVIQGATPNSAQSPEGVDFILRQLRGMVDYKQARANLAAGAGTSPYPAWQAAVGNQLNPQVFQFARLTPEQQATFFNGIPDTNQRASFKRQYLAAKAAGFYGVDNGSQ